MVRRYCFSCGQALAREAGGAATGWRPAALCPRCALGGPQIPPERLRYELRAAGGAVRGPLSAEVVVEQVVRGAAVPSDRVSRAGGLAHRIHEHADFRAYFVEGTVEQQRVGRDRSAEASDRRSGAVRRTSRTLGVGLLAAAGVAVAVFGAQADWFVIPESSISAASASVAEAYAVAEEKVALAFGGADGAAALAKRVVPGEALLAKLVAEHPQPKGQPLLLLHEARLQLWTGTTAGMEEARAQLELAVVLSPADGEIWGSLAEVYAALSERDPSLALSASEALDRADALVDGVTVMRAAAAVAMADGQLSAAADLATPCGDPPGAAVELGKGVDPTCAYFVAAALGRDRELMALAKAYPMNFRVQLARARAELDAGRPLDAVELAGALSRQHPKESAPWGVLMDAAMAVGDWPSARTAGERLAALAPRDVPRRARLAQLLLKAAGDPAASLKEFDEISKLPGFVEHPERAQLYADAAAAANALRRSDEALSWSERALKANPASPAACLQKATALAATGKHADAELALRGADTAGLSSAEGARFHVGAAVLHLQGGRERLADGELSLAREADATLVDALLVRAWARVLVNDGAGAVRQIEEAAYLDLTAERLRSPMHVIWWPSMTYKPLLAGLRSSLGDDLRFERRLSAAEGVIAAALGDPGARALLERGASGGAEAGYAKAALAQVYLERGMPGPAASNAAAVKQRGGDPAIVIGVQARAASLLKDRTAARTLFAQALDRDPQLAVLHRWRGEHLAGEGEASDAARALKEALRLAPDDLVAARDLFELERSRR